MRIFKKLFWRGLFLLLLFSAKTSYAQLGGCNAGVPVIEVDLSSKVDCVWTSFHEFANGRITRSGQCCGVANNINCILFVVTLHPDAERINFNVLGGAMPDNLDYTISCAQPPRQGGTPVCMEGSGPHYINYCKPGSNWNTFQVTSIAKPSVSPPTYVSDGCQGVLSAEGYETNTIQWNSIYPGTPGQYNHFLSCASNCATTTVNAQPGYPPYVDYEVRGTPAGGCGGDVVIQTVRVTFVDDKAITFSPPNPNICFGGSNTSVTANISGGLAPYNYSWVRQSNGAPAGNTQTISVNQDTYTVTVTDATNCPPTVASVTVTANPSPIAVTAGPDVVSCTNNPAVELTSSVQMATGVVWTGGNVANYSTSNAVLNPIYTPTAAENMAGNVITHTVTTSGNGNCPPESDQLTHTIVAAPTISLNGPFSSCANNPSTPLSGTVTDAVSVEWLGGNGSFFPNRNTLDATYTATATEVENGNVSLTLRAYGHASCLPVDQSTSISFTQAPTVDAGDNFTVCANNRTVTLNGEVTVATGGSWSGGSGDYSSQFTPVTEYTPSQAEVDAGFVRLTLTSTGNGLCSAVSDEVDINITVAPIVNAGLDRTVCKNNAVVTLNGSIAHAGGFTWTGGAGGTFSPPGVLNPTYTPTQTDLNNNSVTLRLTSTDHGNCNPVFDEMTINYTNPPVVNAGADQTVCANNATVTLTGSVTGATGGTWSGGTGAFANANSTSTTYAPSTTDISNGSVNLILTSVGNGNCLPVRDTVVVTILPAPIVNSGGPVTVCANNSSVSLNGSVVNSAGNPGTGEWIGGTTSSFSTNRTDLNASYTPSEAEIINGSVTLTLRSTDNGLCNPVQATKVITISPAPTVNAGSNRTVCANNSTVTLNGSVTGATGGEWTGGTGTFVPDRQTLNATYTPSLDERNNLTTVNLTLTTTGNGSCNAVSSAMSISITPAPVVNAGTDRTVCANNASVTLNGTITGALGGEWIGGAGIFNPNRQTLNATYTPSADEISAQGLTLTLSSTGNGNCNVVQDQMGITITPSPIVNAGAPQSVCANNVAITLNGSVTNSAGNPGTGEWIGGTGNFSTNRQDLAAVYTPSSAEISSGSVSLTLRSTGNGNCNAVLANVTHTITPAPVVNAGSDQMVCANNPQVSLNGSVTIADGGTWTTNGSGTFLSNASDLNATYTPSPTDITNGSVRLTLTSSDVNNCTPVSSSMDVTISPGPTANVGPASKQIVVCSNNPTVNLNGSVTVASGGEWIGGMGTFSPNRQTLNATYIPAPMETAMPVMALILETTGNGNCLPARDTLRIFFLPAPVVNAGPDQSICRNNSAVQLAGQVTGSSQTRTWSGGSGSFSPNPNDLNAVYNPTPQELINGSVTLTLTATRSGCNPVSDNVVINFTDAPTVDAGPDRNICSNNPSVSLGGSSSTGAGVWSGGNGTFSPNSLNSVYTPTPAEITAGSLELTLTSDDNGNCLPVEDVMRITFTPAPTANAGNPQTVCANNSTVTLNGSVTVATGGVWSGGSGGVFTPNANTLNATYIPSAADRTNGSALLTLTTTGNGNCSPVTSQVGITITPAPVVNAGNDINSCANNSTVTLNGSVTVASGGLWVGGSGIFSPNRNALNATYTPTSSEVAEGSVTLTLVSTGNGNCNQVSDQVQINYAPTPLVNAGSDQTLCGTVTSVQLNGQVTNAGGGVWTTNGSGTFSSASALNAQYIPSAADRTPGNTVTLTLTSANHGACNPVTDQMQITFTAIPTVNAGPNKTVCTNDFPVQLEGSGSPATWSGGGGTYSPNASTLNATYQPTATEISNGSVTLTLTTTANGPCLPVSSTVTITLPPGPVVNAGPDRTVCGDVNSVPMTASVQNAGGGIWTTDGTGTFSPNATTINAVYIPSVTDKADGSINLRLTSTGNGSCSAVSDLMVLTITPPPTVNAGPDMTRCGDIGGFTLNGQVTVASGGVWTTTGSGSFNPDNATLNATYIPSAQDVEDGFVDFTLTTTGNGTCNAVSDQMRLTLTPAPTVNAGPDNTICADSAYAPVAGAVTVASGGVWSSTGTGSFAPNNTTLNARYYPSAADTTNGTVTLTLTSSGNGTCNAVTDQLLLTINPQPVVDAGPDQTICADAIGAVLNGSVLHSGGGEWTTSGSGSFTNDQDLAATYQPSAADMDAGVVSLTLTSTDNGLCRPVWDRMVLVVTPAPTADAGGNQTVCADVSGVGLNGSVTVATGGIWTSTGTGTFDDPNSIVTTYHPSQDDIDAGTVRLTLTTTGNGNCNAVSDIADITITPAPTVDAGDLLPICGDVSVIQLNGEVTIATGGQWFTSGTGYFTPNAATLDAEYHPSSSDVNNGGVTLTLRTSGNGTCNAIEDQVVLTITPIPTVNAGPDQVVCANNSAIQLAGAVTVAEGGTWSGGTGTFAPNADALNAVYAPSQDEIDAGTVTLTLTSTGNGTCSPVSDYVTFTITPAPLVNAGNDRNVCANNATVNLSGSVTVATGAEWIGGTGVLTPNRESLSIAYTPSQDEIDAGFVVLTLSSTGNGNCLPVSDEVRVNISPAPTVDAGDAQTVCANNSEIQLAGSFTGAGGVIWSGGSGSFSPSPTTPGAVYSPSGDDIDAGSVLLTLRTTDNGNCIEVWDEVTMTITPAPTANAGPSQTICADASGVQLNGSVTVADGGEWSTSGTGTFAPGADDLSAVYTPSTDDIDAGSVSFALTTTGNGDCQAVISSTVVNITPAPTVNAGPDRTICADAGFISLNGTVTTATGGVWTTSG
ncbi:MAG: hypothetical protein ACK4ND_13750, partial [Cytophagaceae bacterium]